MPELSEQPNIPNFDIRDGIPEDIRTMALLQDRALTEGSGVPLPTRSFDIKYAATLALYMSWPDTWCHVATASEHIVGFAVGYPAEHEHGLQPNPLPNELMEHLSFLMVEPTRWGQGIGRLLLREVDKTVLDRNKRWASLWTGAHDNERAQRLYERNGYKQSGRTRATRNWGEQVHYLKDVRAG
jgi:GNAT superfamily N-acetyltransferase